MYAVNDLVRIASLGGGLELNAKNYTSNDLIRIASLASGKGARITISVLEKKLTIDEMIRIASLGNGCVSFKDL